MIEAEYADRLGVCVQFEPRDYGSVEKALLQVSSLGLRHARLTVAEADLDDDVWLDWMLARLAGIAEILPAIAMSGRSSFPHSNLERLLAHSEYFSTVELACDPASDPGIISADVLEAMTLVRRFDKHVVLATDLVHRMNTKDIVPAINVPPMTLALMMRYSRDVQERDEHAQLPEALAAQNTTDTRLPLWLTTSTHATRDDVPGHAHLLVDALATGAERIYWSNLSDDQAANAPERSKRAGLFDGMGQPKLLARLLIEGVAELQRVVALSRKVAAPAIAGTRPVLVTGGAGFIGANLADRLASEGYQVLIYDALARAGVERNLHWLARRHPTKINFAFGDLRDEPSLSEAAASASAVFHLAGQVAVTTSMVQPLADFEVNARGTLALLDALRRRNPAAPLIFASTNKVYGDLADIELVGDGDRYLPARVDLRSNGVSETRPLCFHTPYGCSKGAADQYVLDYAHSFGMRTAVLRMSCIYGERQLGTEDQGWVAHFLLRAIAGEQVTIYGDGRQVRDILHVADAVAAYLAAWERIDKISGRAYNLGGGPANAISLLQLIDHIETLLDKRVDVEFSEWRPGDQRYFVADTTAIRTDLSLAQALGWQAGLARLAEHFGATLPDRAHLAGVAL